jgi:hypothetical protein
MTRTKPYYGAAGLIDIDYGEGSEERAESAFAHG